MRLIDFILSPFSHFDITGNTGSVYIRRYKLIRCSRGNLFLHHIRRGDMDRCLHDHPWDFWTLILWAGYWEQMADGTHWRRPGLILRRSAKTAHRIEVDRPAWSLVWTGPRMRLWGFWTAFGWKVFRPDQHSPICETIAYEGDTMNFTGEA